MPIPQNISMIGAWLKLINSRNYRLKENKVKILPWLTLLDKNKIACIIKTWRKMQEK
jgi:hypothetical protein